MSSGTETKSIVVRSVESIPEIRAVEDLQIEIWGDDERDIVPLNHLVATGYLGGTLLGAFANKTIIGFAYGFYGQIQGRIVHHSHMLAVLPAYRGHNVAFHLKLTQRERVLADGLTDRITWTFDPLQSVNAHFNFAKLGVISDTYKINVYGDAGSSFLHRNGTDRFFVTWLIDSQRVKDRITGDQERSPSLPENALALLTNSNSGSPEPVTETEAIFATGDPVLVEIPADINAVEEASFDLAHKWREETRHTFSTALAKGFVVTKYYLKNANTGVYLLEKQDPECSL